MKQKHMIFSICCVALMSTAAPAFAGWTRQNSPVPGKSLYGIWGSSAGDVFAVGASGTIIHFDGSAWSAMESGTTMTLYGVWGASGTDVYASGGGGTIIHFDGTSWESVSSGTAVSLTGGIWGTSANDIFAVGENGAIVHYDGSGWSAMASTTSDSLSGGLWGGSATDVFAAGKSMMHYDGSGWAGVTLPDTRYITCLWGSSAGDIFAVGGDGLILHCGGAEWATMQSPSGAWFDCVWGSSPSDVFAGGYDGKTGVILHYDGSSWSVMNTSSPYSLFAAWGSSADNVYMVGERGVIMRYDGNPSPSGPCPTRAVLKHSGDLSMLHLVRDRLKQRDAESRKLVALYYAHAGQVSRIITAHPELAASLRGLISELLDRLDTGALIIRDDGQRSFTKKIISFRDALAAHAGPLLRRDLQESQQYIDRFVR